MVSKLIFFLIFIFGIALFQSSCKTREETKQVSILDPETTETNTDSDISDEITIGTELIFRIQRYPCFGTCPVFTMEIYGNGIVKYTGKSNTDRIGDWEARIPTEQIEAIIEQSRKTGFFQLKDTYPSGDQSIADLPSARVYLRDNNKEYTILNRNFANPNVDGEDLELQKLIDFERFVEEMTKALDFNKSIGSSQ
ncbi:MAG: hypothetical protein ACI959_001085 [Limisphaerales bacterium]|jgi:hypothetical protein